MKPAIWRAFHAHLSTRQNGTAHQIRINSMGCLTAFADRPDNQRLAATDITRRIELVDIGAIITIVCLDGLRATPVGGDFEFPVHFLHHTVFHRTGKADGDEGQIGLDEEFRSGNRPALFIDLTALHMGKASILADKFQRRDLKLTRCAFRLAGRSAHLGRPIGPDAELVFLFRRLRTDIELGHIDRALTESRADAIRCRIAAADNYDMLAACENRNRSPGDGLDVFAANAAVLLHEIGHGIMDTIKIGAGNARRAGVSEPPQ